MSKKETAQNGKGSKPRPVNKEQYDKNYERIYGKKEGKR
jgi:hypothetical protein